MFDKPFKLTLGALMRFKQATGKDLMNADDSKEVMNNFTAEYLAALVWACLYSDDKTLTVEQVSDMIDMENIGSITQKLTEAFQPKNAISP